MTDIILGIFYNGVYNVMHIIRSVYPPNGVHETRITRVSAPRRVFISSHFTYYTRRARGIRCRHCCFVIVKKKKNENTLV